MAEREHTHAGRKGLQRMGRQGVAGVANERERPGYITYEQFLDLVEEGSRAEWLDGIIEVSSPASLDHQDLDRFLVTTLSLFVAAHDVGTVLMPPFQMKLPHSGREPDLIYVAKAHLDRLTRTYLDGPADLVVEIVSTESARRDRVVKLAEYEEGGVGEYWLIDPDTQQAVFYQLNAAGHYELISPDSDGVYRSRALPGFWLRLAWLWQQPPPDIVRVLLEIDREAYAQYLREQLRQAGL